MPVMETGLNPALQAILDSLNDSSSNSPGNSSINDESPPIIPGLGYLSAVGPLKPVPNKSVLAPPKSRAMTPAPAIISVSDASGITTWPAALKHVTKYVAQNEVIAAKIRHFVIEQHKHETQWWAGREAILKKHQSRGDNQQQAADLLKSIGGIPTTLRPINEGSEKTELAAYDKKVHGELTKMTAAYDKQLRAMGIPFYAIKHDLVILEKGPEKSTTKGRIDRGELRELQRRMLQHLEDLFVEDD
jgi:hypothetical protein